MRLRYAISELREIVSQSIASGIDIHRASRKAIDPSYILHEGQPRPDEIDNFIATNPLLDFDLAQNLLDPGPLGFQARWTSIRAEEFVAMQGALDEWAQSSSWLGADLVKIADLIEQEPSESLIWTPKPPEVLPGWTSHAPALLLAQDLIKTGRLLSEMHWRKFEELIAGLLESSNWHVELTRGSKDGGIDVIATQKDPDVGDIRALWQAKKYAPHRKVQLSTVREMVTIRDENGASKGIIATTSSLTDGAIKRIKQDIYRLGYKDGGQIERWIRDLM